MAQEVKLCRGLPASGKSTYAKAWVEANPTNRVRINKDDLRALLHGGKYSKGNESQVKEIQGAILIDALSRGKSVIIDDTNLVDTHLNRFQSLIDDAGYKIKIEVLDHFLDIPPEKCIQWDLKRPNSVGQNVIWDMYWQNVAKIEKQTINPLKKDAIIIDVDGTLATMKNRSPYDWSKVKNDGLRSHIRTMATVYSAAGYSIIIVTGRDGSAECDTREWLIDYDIPFDEFYIRPEGDNRKDYIIKQEIYEDYIKDNYNVMLVVDDRPQVIRMWRRLGIPVINANPCDREF